MAENREAPGAANPGSEDSELERMRARIRQLEEHLENSQDARLAGDLKITYSAIFENTGAATVIIAPDTTLLLVNRTFEALAGYPREEVEGKRSWTEFVAPADLEKMQRRHEQRRSKGEPAPKQYEFTFLDSERNPHDISLTIDLIPGTGLSVASLLDITDLKTAERSLRQRERAEVARKLARTVAHEFRQPLAALGVIAELAQEGDSAEALQRNMEKIPRLVERLDSLVAKLLEITELRSKPYLNDMDILDLGGDADSRREEE